MRLLRRRRRLASRSADRRWPRSRSSWVAITSVRPAGTQRLEQPQHLHRWRRCRGCRLARRRARPGARWPSARAIADPLALPAGQLRRQMPGPGRRVRPVRGVRGGSGGAGATRRGGPGQQGGQLDVLRRGQLVHQVVGLEDETHVAAHTARGRARRAGPTRAAREPTARRRAGRSRPPSRCSSVDLPHPLGPITATVSPRDDRRDRCPSTA